MRVFIALKSIDTISLDSRSTWERRVYVMGCRPSKNARAKVRDFKIKHKIAKKNWTNFDFSPVGINDSDFHPGFSDGIAQAVKSKRVANESSKIVFDNFSTTSKTYCNLNSKVATITLRLSTDGSTLQVEKCEIDIDNLNRKCDQTDSEFSPVMKIKRSESAPGLFNLKSNNCGRSLKAIRESKKCVVTLHNEPININMRGTFKNGENIGYGTVENDIGEKIPESKQCVVTMHNEPVGMGFPGNVENGGKIDFCTAEKYIDEESSESDLCDVTLYNDPINMALSGNEKYRGGDGFCTVKNENGEKGLESIRSANKTTLENAGKICISHEENNICEEITSPIYISSVENNLKEEIKLTHSDVENNKIINQRNEPVKRMMGTLNQGPNSCMKSTSNCVKSTSNALIERQTYMEETSSGINTNMRFGDSKNVSHSLNTEFSHLESVDNNGNRSVNEITVMKRNCNENINCIGGKGEKLNGSVKKQMNCDINGIDSRTNTGSNSVYLDNVYDKRKPMLEGIDSKSTLLTFYDKLHSVGYNDRDTNGVSNILHGCEWRDREMEHLSCDKLKLQTIESLYCQQSPPMPSLFDEFDDDFEDDDTFLDSPGSLR